MMTYELDDIEKDVLMGKVVERADLNNGRPLTEMATEKNNDPRRPLKMIKVGVFPPDEGSRTYMAYTRWYSPTWPGCCEHEVEAINGSEAKKIAIREHKERCETTGGITMDDLRLDYSVECEECGTVEDIPRLLHESRMQEHLRSTGWRLIDDSNHCPDCARKANGGSAQDPMLAQPNPPPED